MRAFIQREFRSLLSEVKDGGISGQDYKSALQEQLQADDRALPEYRLVATIGPDHRKQFHVAVFVDAVQLADAMGPSKKDAEQEAARIALTGLANQSR